MQIKTRYRIQFNGRLYKIQYQKISFSLFGHWKRKWVDKRPTYTLESRYGDVYIYHTLEAAQERCMELIRDDSIRSELRRRYHKDMQSLKKNIWKKVWP